MGQQNRNQSAIQRPWKVEGCLKELRKCLLQACNALSIDQVKFSTKMTKNLSLTFLCQERPLFYIACSSIWICSKDLKKGREKGGFFLHIKIGFLLILSDEKFNHFSNSINISCIASNHMNEWWQNSVIARYR